MNQRTLIGIGAVFAAGYAAGFLTSPRASRIEPRPASAVHAAASDSAPATASGGSAPADAVRAFTPGRPFPAGGARAWLLAQAAGFGGDKRTQALAMIEAAQAILTMDAASGRELADAINELLAPDSQGDPAVAQLPDGLLKSAMMMNMVRLAQENPEEAFNMLKANPEIGDGDAMLFVMGRIAAADPTRAEHLALTLEERQRENALEATAAAIGAKDPAAALAFGARYPEALGWHEQCRILESWARRDPQRAMPEAVRAMQAMQQPELLRQPLDEWFKRDPAAATAWAATQTGETRLVAETLLVQKQAAENPGTSIKAYAALQQQTKDPKQLVRLAGTISESLAARDLAAARDWAASLPPGEPQNAAIYQVAASWIKADAPAASEWIRSLPPGTGRDNAACRLIEHIQRQDPAAALEWARSLGSESQRAQFTERVLGTWQEQDPEAAGKAREALRSSPP